MIHETAKIHPAAVVEEGAKIGANVTVGPFTYITSTVEIGEGTEVMSHVVIKGHTTIGKDNRIFPHAVIGEENQDKKYGGEDTTVVIGDRNVIREAVQVHRGTVQVLESINAVAPIAIALGVEVDSVVYRSVIIHNENDSPLQVEERFVNPPLAKDYLQQDFTSLTPHEYLSTVAPLTQARHTVEAITPNSEMCQWLNLYNEEPCLQVIRRTWSVNGIVSFARLISPGSKYRLGGQLTFKNNNKAHNT